MLTIIGLGPGRVSQMTSQALEALDACEVVVGYTTYINLIRPLLKGQEVVSTGMKREVDRCKKAIELALEGKKVAVVSSGDAGIYGMAGLILELLTAMDEDLEVEVIPGITASIAGAALIGAPLMNDFCHISLSDLMTPWSMIEKRLDLAAQADFVICLYNPKSKGRPKHLEKALDIIRQHKGGQIPVAIAKDIGRKGEKIHLTTIDDLDDSLVDMTTTVIVGNRFSKVVKGRMYTPRGYDL